MTMGPPKKIYLQWWDEARNEKDFGDVTWTEEPELLTDPEYRLVGRKRKNGTIVKTKHVPWGTEGPPDKPLF